MTSHEKVQWRKLKPEQRDRMIAEKVMGMPAVCNGELRIIPTNGKLLSGGNGFWRCLSCDAFGSCGENGAPDEHAYVSGEDIPPYSSSLDAAMKAAKEHFREILIETSTRDYGAFVKCYVHHEGKYAGECRCSFFSEAATLCIAMLRAKGCEVDL